MKKEYNTYTPLQLTMSRNNKKVTKDESESESGSDIETTETLEKFLQKSTTTFVRQMTESFVDVAVKFTAKKGLDTTKDQWAKAFQIKFEPPAPPKAPIRPSGGAFAAGGAGRKGKAGQELSDDRIDNYQQMLRDDFNDGFKPKGYCLYCPTRGAETKVYRYCSTKVDGAYPVCNEHKSRNEGKKIIELCKSKKFNASKYRDEMSNKRKQSATRKLADSGINVSGSSRGRVIKEPQREDKSKPRPLKLTPIDKEAGLHVSIESPIDNLLVKHTAIDGKKVYVVQGYLEDPDDVDSVRKLTKAEAKICRDSKLRIADSALDPDAESDDDNDDDNDFESASDDEPKKGGKKPPAKKAPVKKPASKTPAKKGGKKADTSDDDLFSSSDDDGSDDEPKKGGKKAPAKNPATKAPAKAPAKAPGKKGGKKADTSDDDLFSSSDDAMSDDEPKKGGKKAPAKKPAAKAPAKTSVKTSVKTPTKKGGKKADTSDDDLFSSSDDDVKSKKPSTPAKKTVAKTPEKKSTKKADTSDESDDDNEVPKASTPVKKSAAKTPEKSKKTEEADDAASSDDDNDKPSKDADEIKEADAEDDGVEKIRPDDDEDFNLDE